MSLRQSSGYKALLVLASLACVGGAVFLAYKTFFEKGGSAAGLQAAEQAYKQGVDAYPNNPQVAKVRFDETDLTADNSRKKLDQERQAMKKEDADKIEGTLLWLKARAIRDKAYAQGKIDGSELGESTDTSTNEKYRNYLHIREPGPLNEAIVALRQAAERLTDNPELIKDALRLELSQPNISWQFAEPACKNAIKLNPKDGRAHYFLAKYHFEQPEAYGDGWVPTAYDRRDVSRIQEAKEHLKAARANGQPMWRVNHMEADIASWELLEARRSKNRASAEKKSQELEGLLFGENGMLAKAKRGVGFETLSTVDARGIFGVEAIAMKFATEMDGEAADKSGRVARVSDSLIGACEQLAGSKFGDTYLEEAGEMIAVLLDSAQPFVATTTPDAWRKMIGDAQQFLDKYPKAKGRPNTTLMLSNMIRRDANLNRSKSAELNAEAIKTLESGLEAAKKANAPADQLAAFHAALAEAKLINNRPLSEAEAHVRELRTIDSPQARAVTNFLDGVVAYRLGKLERARSLLTAVTTDKDVRGTPLPFKAVTLLGPIALATDDPDAAAGYFGQIAEALKQPKTLDPSAKVWADMDVASADDAVSRQVVATVASGLKRARQEMSGQPVGSPLPRQVVEQTLDPAERLAKTLRKPSIADLRARLAVAEFRAVAGDLKTADDMIKTLGADYPDSVDLLRLRVARTRIPVKGQKETDAGAAKKQAEELIRAFLAANPDSLTGKLFWAQWLVENQRGKEAVDFLRDAKNALPPDAIKRVLAVALAQSGQREEAKQVLGVDPFDPAASVILLQAEIAKLSAEQKKELLSRYEQSGMTRLFEASRKMADGKFEEAAADFNASIEYAALKRAAVSLLQRALIGFAGQDPKKAAERIAEYIGEKPDLAELYLPAAFAALYLDDVGEPTDAWGTRRTMYAAINKWEQLTLKGQTAPSANVGAIKVQFHLLAGNPKDARLAAIKLSGQFPTHQPTLMFLAEQYIVGQDHNLDEAKKYLTRAQDESQADDPAPELLYGVWLEASQKLDDAAKHYEAMTTRFATINTPYARRIVVAQTQKKAGEALLWANKWLEKFPNDPAAALQLIQVLADGGEAADAVKKADEFVAKQVEASDTQLKAVKPELKPEDMTKYIQIARATAQLQTATVFFRAKMFPEAKKRVEVVLKEIPDSPAALHMAGDIAIMEKDWPRAEEVYRTRLKSDKRDFVAGNNLAWLLVTQKSDAKEAYTLVTDVRKGVGDKLISAQRMPADLIDTIGLVYVKLNDPDKFAEMQQLFDAAVKRYSTDPRMHLFLGQAFANRGDTPKAQASLRQAVRLAEDPTNKSVRDGQKVEAKKKAEEALAKIAKQ